MFAAGRAYEIVRNSIGYPHLNVKIGATHAGISVGEDGATHQCNEDIALMRTIPGMTILNPADDVEARAAVKAAIEMEGPVYLRFGRLAAPIFNDPETYQFEIGKGITLREGKDVTLVATGLMVSEALDAAEQLAADYGVTVLPVSCEQLKKEDIFHILESVLKEFPVTQLDFHIPKWLEVLPATHWLKTQVIDMARELLKKVSHMKDAASQIKTFGGSSGPVEKITIEKMEMADGTVSLQVQMDDSYYYQILSDYVGLPIEGEYQLMQTLSTLAGMQKEYDKVKEALAQARLKGYGVMMPQKDEILLDEPEVIRHGNKYGVKMKAQAPSVNLIRAQIETEIAPIVGSEQQAKDLIAYIKSSSKDSEEGIWNANIFGKSIEQIVEDGIQAKISQMTDECQQKLQDTLQKIINDSNGGMICIII